MAAAPTMMMNGNGQQQLISILLLVSIRPQVSHQLIFGINNLEYHCPQEFPSTSANNASMFIESIVGTGICGGHLYDP